MANLKGSKTEDNLKAAFAGESQANRRYLYFAQKADVEGYNDVAAVFRSTAEGETGHAHGHLEFLEESGDPATGLPIGPTGSQPQGRDRRRDARIHRHVSGHGAHARARKASTRSPTGSRPWPRPRRATPAASRRPSTRWPERLRGLDKGDPPGSPFSSCDILQRNDSRPCAKAASKPRPASPRLAEPVVLGRGALEKEMERVFDICHGCRRCFNLCDSFPRLFDLIDNGPTGEVDGVKQGGLRPGRGGLHALRHVLHDQVPLRAAARMDARFPASDAASSRGRRRARTASASSRASSPTPTATAGSAPSPRGLANWATDERNKLTRPLIGERSPASITAPRLPKYAGETFEIRAAREARRGQPGRARLRQAQGRALRHLLRELQQHRYRRAARAVLARNGVETEVVHPACCGMPKLELGDLEAVAAAARQVRAALLPWVDKGYDVIALTPSCALMLKFEWPLILPKDPAVERLSQATFDGRPPRLGLSASCAIQ